VLEVEHLEKRYPGGDAALRGVSFTVEGSDAVFVIGPSGAGKSTLLRCLNRLVEPDRGSVRLDGREITTLDGPGLRAARRDMGMIFQEFNLVERLTVMENVLSGRLGYVSFWRAWRRRFPPEDVEAAFRTLARVGLEGFEDKRADELSGGQRQRVGIARALVQRPKILLVDEPTSSLDPKTSETVMTLIVELAAEAGIPALVNIHDVPLARAFAQRLIGLREGRIVYDGPVAGVTTDVLGRIYGGQIIHGEGDATRTGDGGMAPCAHAPSDGTGGSGTGAPAAKGPSA
jgi:phosphonate transport system ATP-binding protein